MQQVQAILEEKVSAAELRGMLRLRRAEIHAQIDAETARLARVEAPLMTIENEGRAPADGIVLKRLPPVLVAELTGTAAGFEPEVITPVIQPLYPDLWCRLASAGMAAAARRSPTTRMRRGDGAIVVHAVLPIAASPAGTHGFAVVDLPAVHTAAAIIHRGSMDDVLSTGQALARWIDASGYQSAGYHREITLEWSPDPGQWVTELQQPVCATGG